MTSSQNNTEGRVTGAVSRRQLLGRLGALGAMLYGLPLLSGCPGGSTWKAGGEGQGGEKGAAGADAQAMSVPAEYRMSLPADGAITDWQAGAAKGYVMLDAAGQWTAISRVCTHSRCKVNHRAEQSDFECPCHHSIFDLEGKVLKGPAKRDLPHYPVRVEGGELVIDLSGISPSDMARPGKGGASGGHDDDDDDDDHRGRGRGHDEDEEHEDEDDRGGDHDDDGGKTEGGWNP